MMTVAPNDRLLVLDPDGEGVSLVFVTTANLATVFTGTAFSTVTGAWLPQKLYAYEMVLGKVVRLGKSEPNPGK